MQQHEHIWQNWAEQLRHKGFGEFIATILEATAPLNLAAAQLVYIGQPVLSGILPRENINALATLLENPQKTQRFVNQLREE
jgi:type I restriction-modification system DNA methylase subunit